MFEEFKDWIGKYVSRGKVAIPSQLIKEFERIAEEYGTTTTEVYRTILKCGLVSYNADRDENTRIIFEQDQPDGSMKRREVTFRKGWTLAGDLEIE